MAVPIGPGETLFQHAALRLLHDAERVVVRLNTEGTYDWKRKQWAVPISAIVSKVKKVGGQLVSFGGGARYWADGPEGGPHGWVFRLPVPLLFPP